MTRAFAMKLCVVVLVLGTGIPAYAQQSPLSVPEPIRQEHESLHEDLADAMEAGGRTGKAAQQVQQALSGHFEQENQLVMPLLGLLEPLAEGQVTEKMRPAIEMSREVQEELPKFMEEHRNIHAAVKRLIEAAEAENKPSVAEFARRLALHARHEEAVLYPAAILVGQQVQDKLKPNSHHGQVEPQE